MEPTEVAPDVKSPPRSRAIGWLGGAVFGRTPRGKETPQERNDLGILALALIAVAMEETNAMFNIWGPMPSLAAMVMLAILNGLWLKRFYRSAKIIFRVQSIVLLVLAMMYTYLYLR